MSDRTLRVHLHAPHIHQQAVLNSPARYRVVVCGRRFGKTELGKMALVEAALAGGHVWWLAPTYKMANEVWGDLKRVLAPNTESVNNTDTTLTLRANGGKVAVRSAHNPDNLRGAGLDFVVLDEAAFITDDVWPEVIRPMLLERKGRALFLSTPRGHNWFWRIYQRGNARDNPQWAAFHYPSSAAPHISADELAAIQRETPAHVFESEYMAAFVQHSGAVFRGIQRAAIAPLAAHPHAGHEYVMGIDWGRDVDYTAAIVLDITGDVPRMVAFDRFNQIDYSLQRERLAVLAKRWHVSQIWAESNSIGTVNIEELRRLDLPVRAFTTTAQSKTALIEALAVALERGDLMLQPQPVLLDELQGYALTPLPGGGFRYSAPLGGHDDTVIALALAWHAATQPTFRIAFV